MTVQDGIDKIKKKFGATNTNNVIPLMRSGKSFDACRIDEGIICSNLGQAPLLEWKVFEVAIQLLIENGLGVRTPKGNAMAGKLGDPLLPLNSVEGKVAREVYERELGISVFRKVSAISGILY